MFRIPLLDIDDFDEDPLDDAWNKWVIGVVIPIVISLNGIWIVIARYGTLYGIRRHSMRLTGWDAIAYGICWLSVALYVHAQFHWRLNKNFAAYSGLGKLVALLSGIAAIGFIVVRNFVM